MRPKGLAAQVGPELRLMPITNIREVSMKAHRYFAVLTLFCMAMTIITGWEMAKE